MVLKFDLRFPLNWQPDCTSQSNFALANFRIRGPYRFRVRLKHGANREADDASGVNSDPADPAMRGARGPRGPKILVRIFLHNSLHAPLALAIGTKKRRAQLVSLRGAQNLKLRHWTTPMPTDIAIDHNDSPRVHIRSSP